MMIHVSKSDLQMSKFLLPTQRKHCRWVERETIQKGVNTVAAKSAEIVQVEKGAFTIQRSKTGEELTMSEEFRKAVALNPSFDQAWLGLGRAAFALADNQEAGNALRLALRLNPRNYLARRELARVYWRQERDKEAESELDEVAREHADFAEGRAEHGIALSKLRRYPEALAELSAALALGYSDAVVYNYAGMAYEETGDAERAVKAYEKAVQLDPHFAAAYLNLALQYRKRGELAKARHYYRKTCDLNVELCRKYSSEF